MKSSRLFSRGTVRAAGGAVKIAPPAVAHIVALEEYGSPFVAGGTVSGGDVAAAAWILSRPAESVVCEIGRAAETLASKRKIPKTLKKIAIFYGANAREMEKDAHLLADLLKSVWNFYRVANKEKKPDEKVDVPNGLAIVARLMEVLGYSRGEAMRERADVAVALLNTRAALDGNLKILSAEQAALVDALDAAEKSAETA